VVGCCECGDESLGSCATELVSYVRFEVLTVASMKFRVFWDVAPCRQA
jgi:hypothetical protein